MLKICLYKDNVGDCVGVRCHDHAGYAEKGYDIVCAAISTLMINTINSIEKLTKAGLSAIHYKKNDNKVLMEFMLNHKEDKDVMLLINSLVLGITALEESYGKNYIKLTKKSVSDVEKRN